MKFHKLYSILFLAISSSSYIAEPVTNILDMPLFEIGGMEPKVGGYNLRLGADYLAVHRSTGMAGVVYDPTSGFIHVARLATGWMTCSAMSPCEPD